MEENKWWQNSIYVGGKRYNLPRWLLNLLIFASWYFESLRLGDMDPECQRQITIHNRKKGPSVNGITRFWRIREGLHYGAVRVVGITSACPWTLVQLHLPSCDPNNITNDSTMEMHFPAASTYGSRLEILWPPWYLCLCGAVVVPRPWPIGPWRKCTLRL